MIVVSVDQAGFEYDIHSLVKAFYPEQEVRVLAEAEKQESSEEGMPDISIRFTPAQISMFLMGSGAESKGFTGHKIVVGGLERPAVKNSLKQLIYTVLSEYTEKELPWGTLTGIRPTKIPMTLLTEQMAEEEILAYMKDTYFISEEKGKLAIEIAGREKQLLSTLHYQDGYSLYIGIPFCPTTCLYCSFTSYPISAWKKRVADYLTALEREIELTAELCRDKILDTIYIGGGTPTTLEPEELNRLFCSLEKSLDLSQLQEFTVESGRPDSITREKLQVMKKHHVTRISVNPQTMKEETLRLIGRRHTVAQVIEAFQMAREEGFTNINMDLILGLPGETEADVSATIGAVKALQPDSLTVHSLAIKRASRLNQWIEENGIHTLHNTDETMQIAMQGAHDMGMEPYYLYRQKNMSGNFENVGYAHPDKYGIYNILIMEELQTIVALGAGSITKRVYGDGRIERCDNVKDVGLYIERIDEMLERKRQLLSQHTAQHPTSATEQQHCKKVTGDAGNSVIDH